MFELNAYHFLLVPSALSLLLFVYMRLQNYLEYRKISPSVPCITKSLWSELKFSLHFGMKQPREILPFYWELIKKHGPIFHFKLAGRSYVLLNEADDLKCFLSSPKYITKGPEYNLLKPWLNNGLLLSSGTKWQNRRKLLTKAFHLNTLNMYNQSTNKHSRVLANKLLDAAADDKEIVIDEYITLCSLDMMCETIMGSEMNAQKGDSCQYVQSIKHACRSVVERVFKFWLWNDLLFKISPSGRIFFKSVRVLHEFTDNVIKNKKMEINTSKHQKKQHEIIEKRQKKSFLDLLLDVLEEHPDEMTDKDIREEVDTFLFEGHDTSSSSMTMTLILLGIHQDVQNKARDELFEIFGDSDRDATIEDLTAMKYLDAVIKESLRLYPSVPAISRELQTTLELKNHTIPKNIIAIILPYLVHRNESIYENAQEFIPERFLDEQNKNQFLFGYLPFSAGPRNCIGQKYAMNQMKTVISTILRRMRIETSASEKDLVHSFQLILRLESSVKLKFRKI
ncbi:Hypothetical protein CINCED_3A009062 [Cinara cedri]|uniref:Cytochrome P450, E-class, group I,Cytochrome P450,Cytochrome P450, conserved site n=1 Tax=Cinara cedri TaxID=506608 RepID=A0A5E4ND80_9HEMI|nr:Hypothetical protein CINCED_3A009062 [Cinara cedri]